MFYISSFPRVGIEPTAVMLHNFIPVKEMFKIITSYSSCCQNDSGGLDPERQSNPLPIQESEISITLLKIYD